MPDSTNARWDADQQSWVGGTRPESAGGETPRQLNIPTLMLVPLVVLLIVVAVAAAVGISRPPSTGGSDSGQQSAPAKDEASAAESTAEEPSEEPAEDGCADGGNSETCDDAESPEPPEAEDPFAEEDVESQALDGYELSTDSGWFGLHIPEGWQYEGGGASEEFFYHPDDRSHFIKIIDFQGEYLSPWRAMNALESELEATYGQSGYDDYNGAAVLEEDPSVMELNYAYDHDTFGHQDVYVRTFFGEGGGIYAVSAEGPFEEWRTTKEHCKEAANSFCLNEHECS
ncbi:MULTISPECIES: hypothetical protein [Nocardiopsidaceae]|uniref:Uncharacterized protein n=1 Tax=Streptomonospora nanhaiensis TaxID=1323731 RepID=A0ABY6YFJ2_9ACTN|nr:hypothetical protein [Streptomonospora nanhaiensis]WAE71006.1 hypothetical protein OUQ99_17370 [Streptomonospora nanhaiensis]